MESLYTPHMIPFSVDICFFSRSQIDDMPICHDVTDIKVHLSQTTDYLRCFVADRSIAY